MLPRPKFKTFLIQSAKDFPTFPNDSGIGMQRLINFNINQALKGVFLFSLPQKMYLLQRTSICIGLFSVAPR